MDADGRIVDVNRGTEDTFGVKRDRIVGQLLANVFVPDELKAAHQEGLARYLATGESRILGNRVEVPACHADGRRLFVELSIVRLAGIEPPLFVGHLRNIQEQKRKERRLRVSAAAGHALAEHPEVAEATRALLQAIGRELQWPVVQLWRVSANGERMELSEAFTAPDAPGAGEACRSLDSLIGRAGLPGEVWATRQPAWVEDLRQVTAKEIPRVEALIEAGFKSAVCLPVPVHGHVIAAVEAFATERQERDPQLLSLLDAIGGQLGHFIEEHAAKAALADREIRLRDALEREHDARRAAEDANLAKDRFLATVSHELRAPLGPIIGWARMLKSVAVTPDMLAKALDVIARNAELQSHLVDDLLDMSRIAAGKMAIADEPVDLVGIVQAALDTIRTSAAEKGLRLDFRGDVDLPALRGDEKRLQQIVINLLSNAVKFTPDGGQITVGAAREGKELVLTVADTGAGIDPAFLPRIFEPFHQENRSSDESRGGLGLGLAIVRDLVRAHGGTITAASAGPGQGATFTVRLPLTRLT